MNTSADIKTVRDRYADVATSSLSNESASIRAVATAFGYSQEELDSLPQEANMGLSCGNPLALASVKEGEVVVDLGCGGGMDVFLAARHVGQTGRVIGIDMTAEMLARAHAAQQRLGLNNVEFHLATIDQLPLPDASVDCVISNCVINLAPDKRAVFREIFRVLKPGGRLAVSDIALKQTLPTEVKESVEAFVGCISGALFLDQYRDWLTEAGFQAIVIQDTGADLNAYAIPGTSCCASTATPTSTPTVPSELETIPADSWCQNIAPQTLSLDTALNTVSLESPPLALPGSQEIFTSGCCGTFPITTPGSLHDELAAIMRSFNVNQFAASVRVHAIK